MQPAVSDASERPIATARLRARSDAPPTEQRTHNPYGLCTPRRVAALAAGAIPSLLAFAAPASAAAPEAPLLFEAGHAAESAVFFGILSPGGGPGEATYELVYAPAPASCTAGGHGARGLWLGSQEVFEEVHGLEPHTEYSVCLLARNLAGEETASAPVHITTSFNPEAPETGAADHITSTSAELHGVLNPNSSREAEPGSTTDFVTQTKPASVAPGRPSTPQSKREE